MSDDKIVHLFGEPGVGCMDADTHRYVTDLVNLVSERLGRGEIRDFSICYTLDDEDCTIVRTWVAKDMATMAMLHLGLSSLTHEMQELLLQPASPDEE